jgi:hypothetical protein
MQEDDVVYKHARHKGELIAYLVDMGFLPEVAERTLLENKMDLNAAVSSLLNKSNDNMMLPEESHIM